MIDQGELDWKVIGIRADDPLAEGLNGTNVMVTSFDP